VFGVIVPSNQASLRNSLKAGRTAFALTIAEREQISRAPSTIRRNRPQKCAGRRSLQRPRDSSRCWGSYFVIHANQPAAARKQAPMATQTHTDMAPPQSPYI
jgi:hypothetical protein